MATVSVNQWIVNEENDFKGDTGEVLYRSETGSPILLKCNVSEIVPDVEVVIVDNKGNQLHWCPSLSGMDGSVAVDSAEGKLYDFTIYPNDESVEILDVLVGKVYDYYWSDEFEVTLASMTAPIVELGKESAAAYPELSTALTNNINDRRMKLFEAISQYDDEFFEKYMEDPTGENMEVSEIKSAIRKGVLTGEFFPVFAGASYKNKGIQLLLDGVIDYLPSPLDIGAVVGTDMDGNEASRKVSDNEPFSALAFKVMTDPYVGKLTFFRVYRGHMESGSYILNATKSYKERIGRILLMHANNRSEIKEVYSGDIAAAVGLKNTTTGDTLCDPSAIVNLESMVFPEPVIQVAIEPKTKADQDKMGVALQKLAEEDPTFKTYTDEESGQTIIAGMGELHLDIIVDRMRREFNVECNVGRPQVAYRETIKTAAKVQGKFVRQSGGHGQYGDAVVIFEPNPGKGYEFVDEIVGGVVPREFIPSVNKGIENALDNGNLAGYPTIDIKARLVFGSYHDVDSSSTAFEIAGSLAFKETAKVCNPVLLEPIMLVEVVTPDEYLGTVIGDISTRRGRIDGQEARGKSQSVRSFVPLSEMFGYATALRSNTQGRGNFTMQFDHYDECPRNVAEAVMKARSK